MKKIGDYLIYKRDVYKVIGINNKYLNDLDYYILSSLIDDSLKLKIPVNSNLIKDVISKEDVLKVIQNIPNVEIIDIENKLLENEYKKLIISDSYEDLIKIIKTTYLRNKERIDCKKKVNEKDKYYFEKAERLLYTEFSISLNMEYEEVKNFIIDSVSSII